MDPFFFYFSKIWHYLCKVVYLSKHFVMIIFQRTKDNLHVKSLILIDWYMDIYNLSPYHPYHHFRGQTKSFVKNGNKTLVMNFYLCNMQDRTIVSRYMVRHIQCLRLPNISDQCFFSVKYSNFYEKWFIYQKTFWALFQGTSHILHLKSLMLMYYFIFFTIPS